MAVHCSMAGRREGSEVRSFPVAHWRWGAAFCPGQQAFCATTRLDRWSTGARSSDFTRTHEARAIRDLPLRDSIRAGDEVSAARRHGRAEVAPRRPRFSNERAPAAAPGPAPRTRGRRAEGRRGGGAANT